VSSLTVYLCVSPLFNVGVCLCLRGTHSVFYVFRSVFVSLCVA